MAEMRMSEAEWADFQRRLDKERERRGEPRNNPAPAPEVHPEEEPAKEPAHNAVRREQNRQIREKARQTPKSFKDRIVNRVKGAVKAAPQKIKSEVKKSVDAFSKPKRAVVKTAVRQEVNRVSANARKEKAPKFHDYNWSSWASSAPAQKKKTVKKSRKTQPRKAQPSRREQPTQYRAVNFGSSLPVSAGLFGVAPRKTSTRTPVIKSYSGIGAYVPISLKDPRYFTTKTKKKAVSKTKKKRRNTR
jgi:hypothetical protein